MKNLFFLFITVTGIVFSCSKKEPADLYPTESLRANYDTAAVDSFSNGATSIDIVRQIRMSSQKYQDSLKEAIKLQEQERKIKQELEKENKKKTEEEKRKADEDKKRSIPEHTPEAKTE